MTETQALSFADLPQPTPAAGVEAYRRERELALAADPARRANFDRYMAHDRRSAEVDYLPVKLDIENVSRCNFRCTMCTVADWPKGRRAEDMTLQAFERLLDEQVGLLEIKLQGVGEPLLQRDPFFAMIRAARARHIWVRTTTNASLLHLKDNLRQLVDADPNEIQVSIDGATRRTYEAIRVGGRFDQVAANCKALNAYCRDKGVRRTKMWTVVQQANRHELPALVDLAAGLGFASLVFSLALSDWGLDHMNARNAAASVLDALSPEALMALVERGRPQGVEVGFWVVSEKYRMGDPATLCPWGFERAYIGSDSRVSPCCYVGNPDVYEIGDGIGPERSFAELWFGPEFIAFRRAHLEGRLPEICRNCYEADEADQADETGGDHDAARRAAPATGSEMEQT